MNTRENLRAALPGTLVVTGLLLASCGAQPTATATLPAPTASLTSIPATEAAVTLAPTPIALPALALKQGDFFLSVDGTPRFVFSRNVAGFQQAQYQTFLDWTKAGGGTFVRLQLDSLGMGYTSRGDVDPKWVALWDQVFDKAEADGIYVLPVFSGWFDWNAGKGYSTWKSNPFNKANGGPAKIPDELFREGSTTQKLWLNWMQTLVKRWQGRPNILAWEVFSEVNLASGAAEASGVKFVNTAVVLIRSADQTGRPITASLADSGTWTNFYRDAAINFINVHPYPPSGQLDRLIIARVQNYRSRYNLPVLIGEAGLSAETPDSGLGKITVAPNAAIGTQHAIWAGVVSGAMNGRALYWEDSFGIYFPQLGMPWLEKYASEELPAATFVKDVDYTGFRPLTVATSVGVWGAAVGNESMILGWFRDSSAEPPNWPAQSLVTKETATITVPGAAEHWRVDYYDTKTGTKTGNSTLVTRNNSTVTVLLPDFTDDIAFKMLVQQ